MAGRITTLYERVLTTTVNDIEHIEANSYQGFGIVKIFFQPGVNVATANAQVTAVSQTVLKQMPAGTTPPLILNYNASTVPILQLALSGDGLSEQNLADLGPQCRAHASRDGAGRRDPRTRSAASRARCRSISIPARSRRAGFPGRTSRIRSRHRTSSRRSAHRRSASSNTRCSSTMRRAQSAISATCRSRSSMARRSISAMSRTCATAVRRRRTSFTSTARARC